ncbi:hypothetical protein B0H16DRAFT_1732719 [Mycena metata]|uniref:Uncharacterized protein n=1 Tax=Mycena metata TaxID=1033252 RepID=A0AAD7MTN2_9AGAR|nr:hypothetical protein B0H16DRAFT_1732719 [Mycena metata]
MKSLGIAPSAPRRSTRLNTDANPLPLDQNATKSALFGGCTSKTQDVVSQPAPIPGECNTLGGSSDSDRDLDLPEVVPSSLNALSMEPAVSQSGESNIELELASLATLSLNANSPLTDNSAELSVASTFAGVWRHGVAVPLATINAAPRLSWEAVALFQCRLITSRLHHIELSITRNRSADPRVHQCVREAVDAFWDFDTHLSFSISDWQFSREVYLLGSGLRGPPVAIVADRPSLAIARIMADTIIFTSLRIGFAATLPSLSPSLVASLLTLNSALQKALVLHCAFVFPVD